MPSSLSSGLLFLSAYSPLLALFAALDSFHSLWSRIVCGVLVVGSLLGLALFWRVAKRANPRSITTIRTTRRDEDVLTFFVTYVVPFAVAPLDSLNVELALLGFLVLIGLLYIRAGLYRVHPILLLAGYHLFEVEQAVAGEPVLALFARRQYLLQKETIEVVPLAPGIMIESGGGRA